MQQSSGNTRIAKNTLFLFLRTLLVLGVSLYTSRVVLQTLGAEDFGIYNIVGGVVVLFAFISNAMATGTQRHITFELGRKNGDVKKIFSACLVVHLWLSLIVLVLAETIGLWFLNTKMNFPQGSMPVVNIVYQFSIITCIAGIIKVPYNAAIIAYEKMSFYAYLGIAETILKLVIVYLLALSPKNQLQIYSLLVFLVSAFILGVYYLYCKNKFPEIRLCKVNDRTCYKQIVLFSGWTMFGSAANMGVQQGLNIIINLFYGVVVNAAVGIANQVNSAVLQFVASFQQALNPQLVKSYAEDDKERLFDLIQKSAKFSYFILLIISLPMLVNMDQVLGIWLGSYPPHTGALCRIILIGALIECISGPLWVTIFATGRIKVYQFVISFILLLNLPLSYIGGLYGMTSETMFCIRNIIYIFAFIARLVFLKYMIGISLRIFGMRVIMPCLIVTALLMLSIHTLYYFISVAQNFQQLCLQTAIIVLAVTIVILYVGLQSQERRFIINTMKAKLFRKF